MSLTYVESERVSDIHIADSGPMRHESQWIKVPPDASLADNSEPVQYVRRSCSSHSSWQQPDCAPLYIFKKLIFPLPFHSAVS